VIASLGDSIDLLLDGGPTPDRKPSTVVQVRDGRISILREGRISAGELAEAAADVTLMVCTGNTCRSPMAEALMRRMLEASPDESGRERIVLSAGTCAAAGGTADAWARQVMREIGIDIEDHTTRPLTQRMIRAADRIFAMTESHRRAVLAMEPSAGDRTMLLHPDGEDISDPVGGDVEEYRRCRDIIADCLKKRFGREL
jgi:protein-tyrosine phosphatase